MRVATTAIGQAFIHDDFSETLEIKLERLPLIFPLHMLAGGLALALVPLAWAARKHPRWHRPLGIVAAADVILAGMTAYPVAWIAPVSPWSAAGFTAQASVWLGFLGLGIWHIAHGRKAQHRRAMLLMAAAASGAVFFRIWLALWAILAHGRHFILFYACDAWLAWLLPLAATALLLNRTGSLRDYPR